MRSVPYSEGAANTQGHQTHTTGRALSVQCSQSETPTDVRQHRTQQQCLATVRCSVSNAPFTSARNESAPDTQEQRQVPPRPASGECFSNKKHSRDFPKLSIGAIENIHFNFPKALNLGTQTPLYPRNSTSFANVLTPPCDHHQCACVLAFHKHFHQRS